MTVALTINGTTYNYPQTGDVSWGPDATDWASAVTSGMLQKAGGTFQLLAEVDFGTSYGLKALYYKSRTSNVATAGQVRLARADVISFRNEANSANLDLGVNSSNVLTFNGTAVGNFVSVSDTSTIDLTLSSGTLSADIVAGSITNSLVNASAAIAYSKLNLSGSIVNADISGSAAIAYSKLNLTGSILNADISASAAIAFSKLAALTSGNILVGSVGNVATSVAMSGDITIDNAGVTAIGSGVIVDADINASAAIAFSKLASLTSGNILVGSAGNVATSVAMSGDATIVASGALTIANSAVSNAKLANMNNNTVKGNVSGGAAAPSDLTTTQLTTLVNNFVGDSGSGGTKGAVPAPASGDAAAGKFLKADGTWTAPSGSGDVVGPASSVDGQIARFSGTTGKLLTATPATISNSDIDAAAAIAFSKLASLSSGNILVGSAGNVATSVAMSGEATIANTGAVTLSNAAVIGKVLTGYVSGAGVVAATDTILQAIQKLNGNDAAFQPLATLTTKGDIYVATGASTVVRQAAGTNGYVLRANSGQTNGIEYALPDNANSCLQNVGIAATCAASALTIALKTSAGNDASSTDPIFIGFRNATSGTGQSSIVSVTGALSTVISSGSTAGQYNAVESYIYVYAINNAGTVELAWTRTAVEDGSIQTTTAEGGAGGADSASVLYSTTARTGVAVRLIGRLTNTQATAGTWATNPSEISIWPFEVFPIVAKYTTNAAQAVVGGNIIDFEDRVYDSNSCVTTGASWKFTSPKTTKYKVSYNIRTDSVAASVGNLFGGDLNLNGASAGFGFIDVCENTGSRAYNSTGNVTLVIPKGEYIDVRFTENLPAVSLINSGNYEYIMIEEIPPER